MNAIAQYRQRILNEAPSVPDLKEDDFKAPDDPAANDDNKSSDNGDDDPEAADPKEGDGTGEDDPGLNEDDFTLDPGDEDDVSDDDADSEDNGDTASSEDTPPEDDNDSINTEVDELILNISDVDRALSEKALFQKYLDLRGLLNVMTDRFDEKLKVSGNEDSREMITKEIDILNRTLLDYTRFKFSIYSLEKNSINYPLFARRVSDIMDYFKESDANTNK